MKNLIITAGLCLLLLSVWTHAQDTYFNKYYCVTCDKGDQAESIICIGDSLLVIGTISITEIDQYLYWSIGMKFIGVNGESVNSIFIENYPKIAGPWWHCLEKFDNGDFIIAGKMHEPGMNYDCYLARYHPDGTEVWHTFIGHTDIIDDSRGIAIHPDGGIVLVAQTKYNGIDYDIMLVKLNGDGEEEWRHYYGWPGNDDARSITILPDTTMIIGGGGMELDDDPEEGIQDGMLLHVDQYGEPLDSLIFGNHSHHGYCRFIQSNSNLNMISTLDTIININDNPVIYYMASMNFDGQLNWLKYFNGPYQKAIWDFEIVKDDAIIICGNDRNLPLDIEEHTLYEKIRTGFVTKLDSMGNELWYRQYVFTDAYSASSDQLRDLTTDSHGNIYVVGWASLDHLDGSNGIAIAIALLKLAPDGCIEPGCTDTVLYVNGETQYTVGIDTISAVTQAFVHQTYFTISPNPVVGAEAVIRFYNALTQDAIIRLYDGSARMHREYLLPAGTNEYRIDNIDALVSGIYYVSYLRDGVIKETRRVIKNEK